MTPEQDAQPLLGAVIRIPSISMRALQRLVYSGTCANACAMNARAARDSFQAV
jgi:hypothetical protein